MHSRPHARSYRTCHKGVLRGSCEHWTKSAWRTLWTWLQSIIFGLLACFNHNHWCYRTISPLSSFKGSWTSSSQQQAGRASSIKGRKFVPITACLEAVYIPVDQGSWKQISNKVRGHSSIADSGDTNKCGFIWPALDHHQRCEPRSEAFTSRGNL